VLRADVDRIRCCGYAVCTEICPEVFELHEDGFYSVGGDVPPELEDKARQAAVECPASAIEVHAG
jgi:ferredoxin